MLADKLRERKSTFVTLAASFFGTLVIVVSARGGNLGTAIGPLLLVMGAALTVAALRNWEFGLRALLVVVIIEGAVRKWFLPSASELVYFYKDALMAVILIGYHRQQQKSPFLIKRHLKIVSLILVLFTTYAVAGMLAPGSPHLLIGLLGLKAYCLYMPLAFIVPRAFDTKEKVINFLKWYSLIVLPVAVIGAMQFLDTNQNSTLNRYAGAEEASGKPANIAVFSNSSGEYYVRVTSTFSYVSGLSTYLPVMFALLLGLTSLYSTRRLPRGVRALYYAALGATVVTSLMTGSRASVLAIAVVAVVFYCFASMKNLFRRLQHIAMVGILIYAAVTTLFPQAYDAFYNRTFGGEERVNEGLSRMSGAFDFPAREASYAGGFGYGIGLTQNAVPALMKRLNLRVADNPIPMSYEGEPGRVMLELGLIGFSLYTLLRLVLLLTLCRVCMMMRDPESKILAIAIVGALIFPLLLGGAVVSHTQNVYQWFLIGAVLALFNQEKLSPRARAFSEAAAFRPVQQLSVT
ncbi:MAG TPA: hypothetical protein VNI02_25815 [Blastocatellia bacterium]|nr:hypothetical protein [Blastocatellia bacterium]